MKADQRMAKGTDWIQLGRGDTYIDRVRKPLQCLIFITPFLLAYQIGHALLPELQKAFEPNAPVSPSVHVVAFVLMQKFFLFFGAAGPYLPLLAVVGILLGMHIAHRDKWEFDFSLYMGMLAESVAWALPVFVMGMAVFRHAPGNWAWDSVLASSLNFSTECILSIGAGVYEETLFRLIGITLLTILFVDLMKFKLGTAIPLVIVISALLFSAYHYLGHEKFDMGIFAFRTGAGIFFAGVYIFRGFGIVVGAHAFYDLIVVGLHRS
jgi:hypothetical protein